MHPDPLPPLENMVRIKANVYVVWTQAGFKKAMKEVSSDDQLPVEGYPKSYPSVVTFLSRYRGYNYWKALTAPLQQTIDHLRERADFLSSLDQSHRYLIEAYHRLTPTTNPKGSVMNEPSVSELRVAVPELIPVEVTNANLDQYLSRYTYLRGGEMNEHTDSEAMFVGHHPKVGVYQLHASSMLILWVGIQNASSRWSGDGRLFPSVREAVLSMLNNSYYSPRAKVHFFEDSRPRLAWMLQQVESYKEIGGFPTWNRSTL